jgi:hypothetical protein
MSKFIPSLALSTLFAVGADPAAAEKTQLRAMTGFIATDLTIAEKNCKPFSTAFTAPKAGLK